ncbi:MAG: TonB-dependent siderophore receptor [Hyphomicrobiales bacterium]|nr:TonB-dependent siderophore receptor [Hyphomicrobiales bacterium]
MQDASAQGAATGELPALTVEAQKEAKPTRAPARPRAQQARRPAPARAPARPVETIAVAPAGAGGATSAAGQAAPGANPYADPAAPYKVDRSASTKLTQPLLDTPRTVTTIPKEVIEDKGATSFRELVRTTPGLTLGTGEGGNAYGDRVFIRGFDSRNDVYIDGVRDPGVNIRETFNTEQVEILKGPSSIVGGRGTTGGAVNVVNKQPAFVNFHEVTTTLGTDATRRFAADVNRVITPEFAVRANAMWQNADVAGRDFVFDNRWGGALGATWKPSDQFKVTLDYYHMDLDQLPDWGVPFDVRSKRPFTETGVRRENYYGLPSRDFQKAKQDVWSATTEYKINEQMTLTNKSRIGRSMLDYVVGVPGTPNLTDQDPSQWFVNSTAKSRYQVTRTLANQTDLTSKFSTFGVLHTIVAGVEASRENTTRDTYLALDTETNVPGSIPGVPLNLWNPNTGAIPWTQALELAGRPTKVDIASKSAYVLDTLNFSEKLFLTGGVRLDDYSIDASTVGANSAITALSRHDLLVNWNAGATYKILPNWAVYAAYGTSSNPVGADVDGGSSDYGGLTLLNASLGPERNSAAEVGTKMELFDRRLLATAALFQTTKANARETVGSGNSATVVGDGEFVVRGLDTSVGGKVTDRWSLFGGFVWMNSEVTRSAIEANVGKRIANLAHTSFNMLSKYDLTDQFTIGGQATWKSDIYGGTFAANQNVLPARWRFDAFAEYRITKNVTAKIMVQNITNAVIYDAFYRSTAPFVYLAPGRSALASLNFKW